MTPSDKLKYINTYPFCATDCSYGFKATPCQKKTNTFITNMNQSILIYIFTIEKVFNVHYNNMLAHNVMKYNQLTKWLNDPISYILEKLIRLSEIRNLSLLGPIKILHAHFHYNFYLVYIDHIFSPDPEFGRSMWVAGPLFSSYFHHRQTSRSVIPSDLEWWHLRIINKNQNIESKTT